jgi:heptosyltransferase-1
MDAPAADSPLAAPAATAAAADPARRAPRAASRILIVRPSALGDVARTVPALATLRHAWPDARIDWLVQDGFADVIRHHPALDELIPFDRQWLAKLFRRRSTLRGGLRFARDLRRAGYDAVYDLQGLFRSGLFTWFTGAPRRVGYADARELGWLGYNVRHGVNGATRHAVDRMLELLKRDGLEPVYDLRLYTGADDEAFADALIEDQRQQGLSGEYICVAPTARWGSKCWPIDRYVEIVRRLRERWPQRGVVVIAAPSEAMQAARLAQPGVVIPQTTVGQMMATLRRCRLLVCNDSAALHIAVGFDRPIVAIFGPTDPRTVGPYGRIDSVLHAPGAEAAHYRAHRHDQSLISRVSLDEVWRKIEETLE